VVEVEVVVTTSVVAGGVLLASVVEVEVEVEGVDVAVSGVLVACWLGSLTITLRVLVAVLPAWSVAV